MTWLFHKVIVLQIIKAPSHNLTRRYLDAFRLFGFISRACVLVMTGQALLSFTKILTTNRRFQSVLPAISPFFKTLDSYTRVAGTGGGFEFHPKSVLLMVPYGDDVLIGQ